MKTGRAESLVLVLWLLSIVSRSDETNPHGNLHRYHEQCQTSPSFFLRSVLRHLERSVTFYQNEYKDNNVDGLFGLRIAEAYLRKTTHHRIRYKHAARYLPRIRRLLTSFSTVIKQTVPVIRRRAPEYFKHFSFLLQRRFKLYHVLTHYRKSLLYQFYIKRDKYSYSEAEVDQIMIDVAGSGQKPKCTFSSKALHFIKAKNRQRYYTTHQLLVLLIVHMKGCTSKLKRLLHKTSIQTLYDRFSSNIYQDMKRIEKNGYQYDDGDIFLELSILNSLANFGKHYHLRWLIKMLSWLAPIDCVLEDLKKKDEAAESDIPQNVDVVMPGNCSSHSTGLAVAVYASYLHWIINNPGIVRKQARRLCHQ